MLSNQQYFVDDFLMLKREKKKKCTLQLLQLFTITRISGFPWSMWSFYLSGLCFGGSVPTENWNTTDLYVFIF